MCWSSLRFDDELQTALDLKTKLPSIINVVHGIPALIYNGEMSNTPEIIDWIGGTEKNGFLSVGESELDKILEEKGDVLVLFQAKTSKIPENLEKHLENYEIAYDLPVVRVNDSRLAASYGYKKLPALILFQQGGKSREFKEKLNSPKVSEELEDWIVEKLEKKEKTIIKSISSSAFKSSPNEFRNVIIIKVF